MNDLNDSFEMGGNDDSFHVAPMMINQTARTNNKVFASINSNNQPIGSNKCLKVLTTNKMNGKFTVNQEFQDYLVEDDSNPDAVVVSFVGSKKIGKSFLLDCLLSIQNNKICRAMSKNAKSLINSPSLPSSNRNNQKLVYFDCGGQTNPEIFLWTYFLSSMMVYNLNPTDRNEEQALLDHLSFVQSHFDSEPDDLSLPQLIIVRRDAEKKQIKDRDLIRKIQDYGLFNSQIIIIHMPYPGGRDVKAKQLLDVPARQLYDQFTNEVQRLLQIIKSGKPKIIRGNYLSSKILSLALEPITNNLNREHRLSTGKIWDQVIEILSIGFYNFYLKCYSEELQRQFESQKPCDKYSVYKKLSKLRRNTNKKVQGFKNISDQPIFEKYKVKLQQTLRRKEQLVRDVNKRKSRDANTQYCQKLLKELNQHNFGQLIDQYCKSELDDQKSQVLLQQFQPIFEARSKMAKPQKSSGNNPSKQLEKLQNELAELDQKIRIESQPKNAPGFDFEAAKNTIKTKQQKLEELQLDYDELRNTSKIQSQNRNESKQLIELQADVDKLNGQIGQCEREIDELRKKRESKIKQTTAKLEQDLNKEEENLKKLQQLLKQAKVSSKKVGEAKGDGKSTCCSIM